MSSSASGPKKAIDQRFNHGRNSENRIKCRIPQRLPQADRSKTNARSTGYVEHHDPLTTRHEVSPVQTRPSLKSAPYSPSPSRPSSLLWPKPTSSPNVKKPVQGRRSPMHSTAKIVNRNIVHVNYTKKPRSGHLDLPDQDTIQKSEELEIKGDLSDLCVNDLDVRESVTSPRGRMIRMKISWQDQLDKFQVLKKELNERQHEILQLYASLREKHHKMLEHDQKTELPPAEELNIMNVANMTPEQLLALCAETQASDKQPEPPLSLNSESLKLDKFYTISTKLIDTCTLSLAKRKAIVDWIITLKSTDRVPVKVINEQISSLNAENEELQTSIDKIRTEFQAEIKAIVSHIRKLLKEAINHQLNTENLTYKYSELNGENMNLRKQLYSLEHTRTNRNKLEELEKELKEERCKRMVMRDRLSRTENKLKSNKNAMDDLKSHTWALEQAVQKLTEQNQQLQLEFDKDLNKLSESINQNAAQLEEIAEAREKLQMEKEDLEKRLAMLTNDFNEETRNLKNDLKVSNDKFEDMDSKYQALLKEKKELVDKCAALHVQLSKKEKAFEEIFSGIREKEEELSKVRDIQEELDKTKHDLEVANQEIERLTHTNVQQAEKIRELKNNLRETIKLEGDMKDALLEKDEYIDVLEKGKLEFEAQLRENEYKMCSYEEQLSKIGDHITELQKDYGDFDNLGELIDMIHRQREQLLEATRQNGELAEELQKRDSEIEHIKFSLKQRERALEEKEQINKMLTTKEEEQIKLLEVMKNNLEIREHAEQSFNKQLDHKNKEIESILNNLEARKEQICQLEQIVLTLENQKLITEEQLRRDRETIKLLEKKLNRFEVDNRIEHPAGNFDSLMKILENELETRYDAEIKPNRGGVPTPKNKTLKRKDSDGESYLEVDSKMNTTKFMFDNVLKKTILIENHPGTLGSRKDTKWVPLRGAGIAAYEPSVLEKTGMEPYLTRNLPFIVPRQKHDKQSRMFKLATHRIPNV